MKLSRDRKNARIRMALPKPEPICRNCGMPGRHFCPPSLGEPGFFACPQHERIPVTVETSGGPVHGHITGDPDMPVKTRAALNSMMTILAERAMTGTLEITKP